MNVKVLLCPEATNTDGRTATISGIGYSDHIEINLGGNALSFNWAALCCLISKQWGYFAIPDNSHYGDFTLPIAFTTRIYVVTALDVLVASDTSIEPLPPLTWSIGASTNTKFRLVTSKSTLSVVNAVILGK